MSLFDSPDLFAPVKRKRPVAVHARPAGPPPIAWKRNPGHLPDDAKGKRVRVKLRNGAIGKEDGGSMVPPGWAADGKGGCRWSLTGDEADIEFYVVL